MAKRKANEIEAQAVTGSGKKIIIMSDQSKPEYFLRLSHVFNSTKDNKIRSCLTE